MAMADFQQFERVEQGSGPAPIPRGWLLLGLAFGSWAVVIAAVLGFLKLHSYVVGLV